MKKTVRINFIGFYQTFNKEENIFTYILRQKYNVEISQNPDYIFYSNFQQPFEYTKFDGIRIYYTLDLLSPDFTAYDYVITYDNCNFGDRYFRLPDYYFDYYKNLNRKQLSEDEAEDVMKNKKYFCNFIQSHKSLNGERENILNVLSNYKRVECGGIYLNNQLDGKIYSYSEKYKLIKLSKFTLACEPVRSSGYVSEKMLNAFFQYSIPIYWGDIDVIKEYNPKAFINANDLSESELLDIVKEIDNNDNLYKKMLMETPFITENYAIDYLKSFENFLFNIFDSEKEFAFRRHRYFGAEKDEGVRKMFNKFYGSTAYKICKKLKKI